MRVCGEERGHVVVSLNKQGKISGVNCPQCGLKRHTKKGTTQTGERLPTKNSAPYDLLRSFRHTINPCFCFSLAVCKFAVMAEFIITP
jgi:hypothetical protein